MSQPLKDWSVFHGGVMNVVHPRLQVPVAAQTAVRYLRFRGPATIETLELRPARHSGRWVPVVPTHPAHVVVSVLDESSGRWRVLRDVELSMDPRIAGQGLTQDTPMERMEAHFEEVFQDTVHVIDLGGVRTDHLRVECDREHPVWPNHGECNGGPFHAPFSILDPLTVIGEAPPTGATPTSYRPILKVGKVAPRAPRGMKVRDLPDMILFEGRRLSVGFSLRRPELMHLGWDVVGQGLAGVNRLVVRRHRSMLSALGGLTGPMVRTLQMDIGSQWWTGRVSIAGNRVAYRGLTGLEGLTLDAVFTVEPDRLLIELTQQCEMSTPVIEAEAWRLAWNLQAGMTAMAAEPALADGRSGDVKLPGFLATDGAGCLSCRLLEGDPAAARWQTESFRHHSARTDGMVLARRPGKDECLVLPAGRTHATFELATANFEPAGAAARKTPSLGLRRHWASVFSCFRAELGGFSNHAASINCHVNQGPPVEIACATRRPTGGPDPMALAKFTIRRALLDGGGYGYHRNLYLDSDPILLSMAGRIFQAERDPNWIRSVEPGLLEAFERIAGNIDSQQGLVVCRALSGNTGSHRWSSNAMDVVGFGHIDAYVNAWSYRAMRNATALFRRLGRDEQADQARRLADGILRAFAPCLVNPDTGIVAGWRSRDGALHDSVYLWLIGPAVAFGLLDRPAARRCLGACETLRHRVGLRSARLGLPCNLLPIDPGDHMLPKEAGPEPTFETYTDGALSGSAGYYIRALRTYGFARQARALAEDLDAGYAAGMFTGPMGAGQEFLAWDGRPTGYEGTLVVRLDTVQAIAIEQGVLQPSQPEWWPAED